MPSAVTGRGAQPQNANPAGRSTVTVDGVVSAISMACVRYEM